MFVVFIFSFDIRYVEHNIISNIGITSITYDIKIMSIAKPQPNFMKQFYKKYGGKLLLSGLLSIIMLTAYAQKKQFSGIVTDTKGVGIPNANIRVKNEGNGVLSSSNGAFVITAETGNILVISVTGFIAKELVLSSQTNINVQLQEDFKALEEVVVVGYGSQKKSSLTGSISKLDKRILESGVRSNPAQALAGTIAGLRVSTTNGKPGSVPNIILRGGTNFDGSGSPLIVVDGQFRPSFSDINPEDIESMEVLKDASATAIYGARASNGVILVTLKRGKQGSSTISFKSKTGFNYLNSPYKLLDGEDYLYWGRKALVETFKINGNQSLINAAGPRGTGNLYKDVTGNIIDGNYNLNALFSPMRLDNTNRELLNSNEGWKTMKDPIPTNAAGAYDPNGTYADLIYKEFSYADNAFRNKALLQDYNIGINGGNDKGSYYANVGYYNETGIALAAFYKRLNFTLNGDYKVKNWLKSESSLAYSRANSSDQAQTSDANYWGRILMAAPTMRGSNYKGEPLLGRNAGDGNPAINLNKIIRDNQADKITFAQAFKVDFSKNLFLRTSAILMYDEEYFEGFNKDFRTGTLSLTDPNAGWDRTRSSTVSFDRTIRQTYNALLNYSNTFKTDHHLDAMISGEYFDSYNKGMGASGKLAPTDDFQALNLTSAAANDRGVSSYHLRDRMLSAFSRVNYNYKSKYLASATVRADGSSRLIGDNQFGIFPGASIGWVVSREDFMADSNKWLSFLKIRASYGKNGNIGIGTSNGIGLYELQGGYNTTVRYENVIGFQLGGIPNPILKWEKTNTVEGAIEYGLFNKINGSFAFYNRITSDKITNVALPNSSGISSLRSNNGSIRNQGFEAELSYKALNNKNWTVNIGANIAWNKNKVLKLPFNGNQFNRQGGTQIYDPKTGKLVWVGGLQEGQEPNEIFGYLTDGIIRNQQDFDNYNKVDLAAGMVQLNGSAGRPLISKKLLIQKGLDPAKWWTTSLGDMRWKDIDKNDTIDTRDRVSLGRIIPRWTGGVNFAVGYKGLQLFARLDFALNFIQMDFRQMWALGSMQGEFNGTNLVKDTWTPENPNAKYPTYVNQDQQLKKNYDRDTDMFWVNSSYLSFREITLSYALPKSLIDKANIGGLTLQVTGQHLGYLSNKLLKLPERTGSQDGAYTIPTSIVFSANLTF